MNIRKKIRKEIKRQKQMEGEKCQDKILLKILSIVSTQQQWDTFVDVKLISYGSFSYQYYRFYYPKKELLELMRWAKQQDK
jgi:hypothetical protein